MSQSNSPDPGRSLERWLGGPVGATPPDDLDRDVVEAVYALRPDLAPAPRLTADDILATVTRGPLADPSRSLEGSLGSNTGAEVVPFPVRGGGASDPVTLDADPAPRRTHRLWKWVGGTGGIGMALVAAATLLLVVTPVLYDNRRSAPAPASDAASFGGSPGGASPGAVPTGAGPGAAAVGSGAGSLDDRADAPVAAAPPAEPPAIAAAPARGAAQAVGGEVSAPDVFPIARDGVVRGPSLIPELDERRAAEVDRSVAPAEVAAAPAA
ncbi:MAG: hypothetical protein ABMB14_32410, partial [Myxococcota bacterium]